MNLLDISDIVRSSSWNSFERVEFNRISLFYHDNSLTCSTDQPTRSILKRNISAGHKRPRSIQGVKFAHDVEPKSSNSIKVEILPEDKPKTKSVVSDQLNQQLDNISIKSYKEPIFLASMKAPVSSNMIDKKLGFSNKIRYKISVATGCKKDAGTSARVYIAIKGSKGELSKFQLTKKQAKVGSSPFSFKPSTTNVFYRETRDVGDLFSVVVEHDGVSEEDSWYLKSIKILKCPVIDKSLINKVLTGDSLDPRMFYNAKDRGRFVTKGCKNTSWNFVCEDWLSLYIGDCLRKRQLYCRQTPETEYEVVVVTGNLEKISGDGRVFLTIYGNTRESEKLFLDQSNSSIPFQRNQSDVFRIATNSVGAIRKICVEYEGERKWYLERMVITDLNNLSWRYYFHCKEWITKKILVASLNPMDVKQLATYKVTLYTGSQENAGTDANVYLTLVGNFGESTERRLSAKMLEAFKTGSVNEFNLESLHLGALMKVKVRHDNSGSHPDWFLLKVVVDDSLTDRIYTFHCNRWFSLKRSDGKISRELFYDPDAINSSNERNRGGKKGKEKESYQIKVKTGDCRFAGTSANVYVILYGPKKTSKEQTFRSSKDAKSSEKIWLENGKFEKNSTEVFHIETTPDLFPLEKIDVGHDNKGLGAGWFLEEVKIKSMKTKMEQTFTCNKWLANDKDSVLEQTLYPDSENKGAETSKTTYKVTTKTSDVMNAGTDANVWVKLFGDAGDTGDLKLSKSETNVNKFERNHEDVFLLKAPYIGKIRKLKVWHDGSGLGSRWHLSHVVVAFEGKSENHNPCRFDVERWIEGSKSSEDTNVVEVFPSRKSESKTPQATYKVTTKTSDVMNAGTDANVWVKLFGDAGDTGDLKLSKSETNVNKFERNHEDVFLLQAPYIGKLRKLKIWHDGSGFGSSWHLSGVNVEYENKKGNRVLHHFPVDRWIEGSKTNENGIALEAKAEQRNDKAVKDLQTTYEVNVWTGDEKNAGTDANVFIQMFGDQGSTNEIYLDDKKNNFERAHHDVFKIDEVDIGNIKKIRVGHDNSGIMPGWFLDKILIRKSQETQINQNSKSSKNDARRNSKYANNDFEDSMKDYLFICQKWFDKGKGDGQLVRELYPTERGDDSNRNDQKKGFFAGTRPRTSYEEEDSKFIIRVKTGDVSGAGTDANVFLKLIGSADESKEFQLDDSLFIDDDNNDDIKSQKKTGKPVNKFEKGKEDTFEASSKYIGDLKKLIIRHDNKGLAAAWFVEWITVYDARNGRKYFFPCEQWLSSNPKEGGKLTRVLLPVESEKDLRNTDKRSKLSQSTNSKGNRGEQSLARNSFDLKSFQNRRLSSSRSSLKHRNYEGDENDYDGDMPDNYDSYDDEDYDVDDYSYKADDCDSERELRKLKQHEISRSLNFGKTDKRPSKSLIDLQERTPRNERKLTEYCVEVYTGNKFGAGTDANAYLVIFGSQGTTGMLELKESQNRNKFEKNQMDRFLITAPDVGNVKKIAVGHDASGVGSDWFLEKVKLSLTSAGKNWTFPCNEWLTADENEKELIPN